MTLAGIGTSKSFSYRRGGWQGGVNTPDEFNNVIEHIMEPLVASWHERGYDLKLGHLSITHIVWADNIILIANNLTQLEQMANELSKALEKHGYQLKHDQLDLLTMGEVNSESKELKLIIDECPNDYHE